MGRDNGQRSQVLEGDLFIKVSMKITSARRMVYIVDSVRTDQGMLSVRRELSHTHFGGFARSNPGRVFIQQ